MNSEADGPTRALARFAVTGLRDGLPVEAVDAIEAAILDTLAVTVAGIDTPPALRVRALAGQIGGPPAATVIGTSMRTDPATAALVNGTSGHALDYDDVSFAASAHPSISLLPALLAVGEATCVSGAELLRAYAIGFQCAVALGRTLNPGHYGAGWHGTGTIGSLAAVLATSTLRGLDEERTAAALAIGASDASGLRGNFGTDIKPYQVGNAGRAAVAAVALAETGAVAVDDILEREHGFFSLYSQGSAPNRLVDGWEAPLAVLTPGMTTKLFPSCASSHASIGSALALRADGLRADEVESITVSLTDVAAGNMKYPRPHTGLEAKFSMQYCVARSLIAGTLTLEDFTEEAIAAAPRELMERIVVRHDPELTGAYEWGAHRPSVMEVRTLSGDVLSHRADAPPGRPGTFTREMLHDKARDCLARGQVVGSADEIIALVDDLDHCPDITALMRLLAHP